MTTEPQMTWTPERLAKLEKSVTPVSEMNFTAEIIPLWHEAAQSLPHLVRALESAENAILQYELALNEAAEDYNKISEVCKSHGLMSSYRESVETAAYIRAMLHKHSSALSTIRKAKAGEG